MCIRMYVTSLKFIGIILRQAKIHPIVESYPGKLCGELTIRFLLSQGCTIKENRQFIRCTYSYLSLLAAACTTRG